MKVTTPLFLLFLLCVSGSSCGYLDQDLFVDEETFEDGLTVSGIGLSGSGYGTSSGCGGFSLYGRHARTARLHMGRAGIALPPTVEMTMSDMEILERTDVEMIDETTAAPSPNMVEKVYFSAMARRDQALAETY